MKNFIRSFLAVFAIFIASSSVTMAVEQGAKVHPERMMLLDLVRNGDQLFATGERGVIIHSDDDGKTLQLIKSPTTRTLTKIVFLNTEVGIAAGHGGVLLRTADGGKSWNRVELEGTGGDSLLGASVLSNGHVIVYGAFGMYFESSDQGLTWVRREVVYEGFDWHISQVIETNGILLLVGEAGSMGMSADMGETWTEHDSPYEGSFFGGFELPNKDILVYGMRGNVFISSDGANTWTHIKTGTINALNTGFITQEGMIILGANNGLFLISEDNGKSFYKKELPVRAPLSAIQQAKDGTILYVGVLISGFLDLSK